MVSYSIPMVSLENRVGHPKLPREAFYLIICPASGAEFTKKRNSDMTKAEGFRRSVRPGGGEWTIDLDQLVVSPRMKVIDLAGKGSEGAAKRYPTIDST